MRRFILSLSGKLQAFFIIGMTVFVAFLSAIHCGLYFDVHQLVTNTDLISSVYQVMGTVYAILLTFTLWGVWQNFSEAGTSVQNEAYALLDLVHMLETLDKDNNYLREAVLNYSKFVIEQEWPLLEKLTNQTINFRERHDNVSQKIVSAVQNLTTNSERDVVIFGQTLNLLTRWLDARRTRILIARGDSAKAIWPLLFTGAFVLFSFHGLFVAKTLGIWITLLFGISLVIGVTFYLIFSLDCPFTGSLSIDSEPFSLTVNLLKKENVPS